MNIAMLGSGFIGRFYADSLQGYRSKDKIVSIYSRRSESAKKFAADYNVAFYTTNMEEAIDRPEVDVVCIALPNNLHEEAVHLCCKHKKAVITTKPLGRNAAEARRMLDAVEKAGIFNGYLEDLVYTPKFIKALCNREERCPRTNPLGEVTRNTSWPSLRLVLGYRTGRWWLHTRPGLSLR